MKIKNITFAIPIAPAAIPPNPNIAATIAIMKNIIAKRIIIISLIDLYIYFK